MSDKLPTLYLVINPSSGWPYLGVSGVDTAEEATSECEDYNKIGPGHYVAEYLPATEAIPKERVRDLQRKLKDLADKFHMDMARAMSASDESEALRKHCIAAELYEDIKALLNE